MTENQYQTPTREQIAEVIYRAQHPDNGSRWLTTVDGTPNVVSYVAADAVLALFQQPTPSAEHEGGDPYSCADLGHIGDRPLGTECEEPSAHTPAEPVSIADMAPGTAVKDARGVIWYRGTGSWVAANGPGWPLEPVAPVVVLDVTPPSVEPGNVTEGIYGVTQFPLKEWTDRVDD